LLTRLLRPGVSVSPLTTDVNELTPAGALMQTAQYTTVKMCLPRQMLPPVCQLLINRYVVLCMSVYGWIVQFSGLLNTKACTSTPSRLFTVPRGCAS